MCGKTKTLFTTTMLSLVFYGLSTSSALANSSQPSLQGANPVTSASSNQNVSGIINSYNSSTLEVKLADGTSQRYQLNPNLINSENIRKGAFVALLVDGNQIVQKVQPAEVEKTIEGIVREIVGYQVTLELPNGQIETTAVAPAVSARMGLAKGVPLMVTSYKGISATKICLGKTTPPAISLPPVKKMPPVGGGEPPAIKPPAIKPPVRALW